MSAGRNAMTRHLGAALALAAWTLAPAVAAAQSREWTTNRYDAQRTGWVRSDPRISKESVEDGTFVKLREVTLNYNLGTIGGAGNWTLGVVGRNLFTVTDYRGYDPEVGTATGNTGGQNQLNSSALNAIDYFNFPNLRTFTFLLSTSF